ncbi:MAG: NifU family protein [Nitrospinae bacterium]|nr:NifU family protein [Nitrospinota bacterium]
MKLSEILAARDKAKEKTTQQNLSSPTAVAPRPVTTKSALKVIRTRETPNDDALQYVLNAQILDHGNKSYASKSDCDGDPLGKALFERRGVKNVYVMENFVTVTKDPDVDWNPLKDQIWKTIDKNVTIYQAGDKAAQANIDVTNFPALSQEDKLKAIEMVLDRSIRSNLARDGGGVEVKGLEDNVVRIEYHGACGSCATSTSGTLQFIQTQLKQQLHSDLKVKPV